MKGIRSRVGTVVAVGATVITVAMATACGSGTDGSGGQGTDASTTKALSGPGGSHPPLFSSLPESIQKAGKIEVGMEVTTQPFANYGTDGKTPEGIDPDLANAAAKLLGVTVDIQDIPFAQGIPALNTGRIDMYWTFTNDTAARRGQVDLVDFTKNGQGVLLPASNPKHVGSLDGLCGTTISIQSGSNNLDVANAQSAKCGSEGKAKVTVLQFDELPQALLQLKGGRADALMTSYAIAGYYAKSNSSYTLMPGQPIQLGPAGVTFKKGNAQLETALQKALQQLVDNGTYAQIFQKWGLDALKIPTITINAGT